MSSVSDSEKQELIQDALQEILNISMGQAANSLAKLIDTRVVISIPKLHWVKYHDNKLEPSAIGANEQGILARQSFLGGVSGEIIVCFKEDSRHHLLADSLGYSEDLSREERQELTLEITNILCGACLRGLAEQLEIDLSFGAPSMLSQNSTVAGFLKKQDLVWSDALFMEIRFTVESISMNTGLLICMSSGNTDKLFGKIEELFGDDL